MLVNSSQWVTSRRKCRQPAASPHLDGVEPRAVGRQVEEHETARGAAHHRLDLFVLMGSRVVPGNVDALARVLRQQRLEELGDLPPALSATYEHDGLAGAPVRGTQAVASRRLRRRGDHHPLADWDPEVAQRRVPGRVRSDGQGLHTRRS